MNKQKERKIKTVGFKYSCLCQKCGWRFMSIYKEYRMCPICFEKHDIKVIKKLNIVE